MKLATCLSLLLLSSIASGHAGYTPPQTDEAVFDSLWASACKLREDFKRVGFSKLERGEADTLLNDIVIDVAKIQETAKARPGASIPPQYLESLRLDAELLASAAAGASNSDAARKRLLGVLRSVAEDLDAKVAFSEKQLGAGLRLVELIVRTQKDGVETGGYEVWYVPRGWSDTPDKFRRSDHPSSPAIMNLAPGNYLVWLKKGDMSTEKVPYTLGKDGSRKEIVFPIP